MADELIPSTRAVKKERTRLRILENAIALFRARGIRGTRLAEVANVSEVSVATLFNYFPSKSILAEAWVRGEVLGVLGRAISEAAKRERSLRSAIRIACRELAEVAVREPALRLEAWGEAGRAVSPAFAESTEALERLVADLQLEQQREHVRGDLEARALAESLLDAVEGGVIAGLRQVGAVPYTGASTAAETELARCIRDRVDLLLDGFRKRNERVILAKRAESSDRPTAPAVSSPPPST